MMEFGLRRAQGKDKTLSAVLNPKGFAAADQSERRAPR
jgi:hypothetical protein